MDCWRLISDPPLDGAENMAIDEAVLRCSTRPVRPTIRFYSWKRPTITIGYLQDPTPYADGALPVVRRITGGRAVLHDMELTYSVVAGTENPLFAGGITAAYSIISKCMALALRDAGVPAEFLPVARRVEPAGGAEDSGACFHAPSRCEIVARGRKLVGSAQRRFKDVFLQHGSILLGIDEAMSRRVFGPGLASRMTCVKAYSDADAWAIKRFLIKRLSEGLGCSFVEEGLSGAESLIKGALIRDKYSMDEWNIFKRPSGSFETSPAS